ncbi:MAG: hypothetical protein LQ345_006129, partial [Seirophora villosa]
MEEPLLSVRRVGNDGMSNTTRQRLAQELNQPGPAQYRQLLTLAYPGRRRDPDRTRFEVKNFHVIVEDRNRPTR